MGACQGAPMMQVDDRDYYENLTVEQVDQLLERIASEEQTNGQ
jgi:NADH:ubiquinone oxidoreductase subunit E